MNDTLTIFKEVNIQSKEELLCSLKNLYEEYRTDDSILQSKKVLLMDFIRKIESTKLPNCDDWWFYSYDLTRFGMTLEMCHGTDFVVDSETEFSMSIDEVLLIIEMSCSMMTVSEFADLHGVQPVAVRQWIRRGKLRSIKKQGRDWMIASIAEKPSRKYRPVTYSWDSIDRELYKDFPFLKGMDSIHISQSMENKAMFVVKFGFNSEIMIGSADCEKLELALLSMNDIDVCEY